MEILKKLRDQHQRIAALTFSARANNPTSFAAQRTGSGAHSEIKSLPTVACEPIQELDAGKATFGQWIYSAGGSGLGGGPLG